MLARVTKGKDGVVDYLVNGIKSGRDFSRDDLDHRVCIDGNLDITDQIIKQLNRDGRESNYLHITLSFGERDLSESTIVDAYEAYKDAIMKAYHADEYNVYAEIHYPKIKSYLNKKTGETIERLPHVHLVIPKKNLLTENDLNPFGKYTSNIKYHDGIQESVNRAYGLESPYDNQRKYRMNDNSEFISRYKGDTFKGAKSELKKELFGLIESKNIHSMAEFEKVLSGYGEVSRGKAGSSEEYLKVKLEGESKNVRLTETGFKPEYINDRILLRPKPTDKAINKLVDEWVSTRAHEVKHIHPSSPKVREEYYSLSQSEKEVYINERRSEYDKQFNLIPSRREASKKSGLERTRRTTFTQIPNGLPSMPQRALARTRREGGEVSESVLSDNADHYLESRRSSGNHKLRWTDDGRGGRREIVGLPVNEQVNMALRKKNYSSPVTLSEQLLKNHFDKKAYEKELLYFRVIKKKLDPERLLSHFEKDKGLIKSNYKVFRLKNGSPRIKIGSRAFNVSDFCTQHMHIEWNETKEILKSLYNDQSLEKEDRNAINSISFVSDYVTSGYVTDKKLSRLDESIMILKYLQRKETYEEKIMAASKLKTDTFEKNTITSEAEVSLTALTDRFKRQKDLQERLEMRMGDLVSVKDIKNKKVNFFDKNTGEKVFTDEGERIILNSRKPTDDHVVTAMTVAAEKFGRVSITGTKEFKQQVIDVAVVKDLKITFKSAEMQELFIKSKEEFKKQNQNNADDNQQSLEAKEVNAIENKGINQQSTKKKAGNIKVETEVDEQSIRDSVRDFPNLAKTEKLLALTKAELDYVDKYESTQEKNMDKDQTTNVDDEKNSDNTKLFPFLVKHGKAPFQHKKGESDSYYVEMSNGVTKWGKGLESAIQKSNVEIGDTIDVKAIGEKDVVVDVDVKDSQGKIVGVQKKEAKRIEWDIKVVDVQKIRFATNYDWDADKQKLKVTFNGDSPTKIPDETLQKIMAKDNFLKAYTLEEVKSGVLDMKKSESRAVDKIYNPDGDVIVDQQKASNANKASQ